jgi:hypothetical protein
MIDINCQIQTKENERVTVLPKILRHLNTAILSRHMHTIWRNKENEKRKKENKKREKEEPTCCGGSKGSQMA